MNTPLNQPPIVSQNSNYGFQYPVSTRQPFKKRSVILVIIVILFFCIGMAAIWFFWPKVGNISETKGWTDYSKDQSSLSFKYPPKWFYLEMDEGKTVLLSNTKLQDEIEANQSDVLVRLSLIEKAYTDDELVNKYGGEYYAAKSVSTSFKNARLGTRSVKIYDSRNNLAVNMPAYPQLKIYKITIGSKILIASIKSLNIEKYESDFNAIVSTITVKDQADLSQNTGIEYNKNGIRFYYPKDWLLEEEWTGRNNNLGEVRIDPPQLESESYANKSIRFSIRTLGMTVANHQLDTAKPATDINIDSHTGKKYSGAETDIGGGASTNQEIILAPLNDKYELSIWSENADLHKTVLEQIINSMKIDLGQLDSAISQSSQTTNSSSSTAENENISATTTAGSIQGTVKSISESNISISEDGVQNNVIISRNSSSNVPANLKTGDHVLIEYGGAPAMIVKVTIL